MESTLYLRQLEVGPMENFIYLIGDKTTRECVMVDPAWDVESVLKVAEADDMKVIAGLCTHAHYDHVNGADKLIAKTGGPVYIHKDDAPYVREAKGDLKKVDSEEKLKVGQVEITFLHTPGHTPGSQCFLVQNQLISGDTLFINACGRCDLPGGDAAKMYESLQRLAKLPEKTTLFPGHNYAAEPTSTMGQETRANPYYQMSSLDEFLGRR